MENQTFEGIISRLLARVPARYDKRETSVIYNALAPAAAELATLYCYLSVETDRAFIDTAAGDDLTNKAKERGIQRFAATFAIRRGVFRDAAGEPMEIPLGCRFSGGSINFAVTERMTAGEYQLTAETVGEIGNQYAGMLIPIDYIAGLGSCELTDILVPGEEEENDEALRARWYASVEDQAFGGNIADYRKKVKAIQGVGGVRVFPAWNGGGTVKLVLMDSSGSAPSAELVALVQEQIDPPASTGQGYGIAPIGHKVTVEAVSTKAVEVSLKLTLAQGTVWETVQPEVEAVADAYFSQLTARWEDEQVIIRISKIESAVLDVPGVVDVTGTTLNGQAENLELALTEIPTLGGVMNASA